MWIMHLIVSSRVNQNPLNSQFDWMIAVTQTGNTLQSRDVFNKKGVKMTIQSTSVEA